MGDETADETLLTTTAREAVAVMRSGCSNSVDAADTDTDKDGRM